MKNKIVKAVLAHICIAYMALGLMGCGNIGTIIPGTETESKPDGDNEVAENSSNNTNHDFGDFDVVRTSDETTDEAVDETTEEIDDYSDTDDDNSDSPTTARYLSAETQAALDSLDTDINKVKWGVQYSPTGMDHVVISITPYIEDDYYHLVMAITNLYYAPIIFDASGYAKGFNGENVADITIYESMIAPGNSAIVDIPCSDVPSGEIHWDVIETPDSYLTDAYWESDWSIGKEDDNLVLAYNIYSTDMFSPGYVYALALDENGYVIDCAYDYNIDEGTNVSGTIEFDNSQFNGKIVNVAFFANPALVE